MIVLHPPAARGAMLDRAGRGEAPAPVDSALREAISRSRGATAALRGYAPVQTRAMRALGVTVAAAQLSGGHLPQSVVSDAVRRPDSPRVLRHLIAAVTRVQAEARAVMDTLRRHAEAGTTPHVTPELRDLAKRIKGDPGAPGRVLRALLNLLAEALTSLVPLREVLRLDHHAAQRERATFRLADTRTISPPRARAATCVTAPRAPGALRLA